jgi:cytochrome b subunit of formate dehydrogenase
MPERAFRERYGTSVSRRAITRSLPTVLVAATLAASITALAVEPTLGIISFATVACSGVGAVITRTQPENRIGWVLLGIGTLAVLTGGVAAYGGVAAPRGWPLVDVAVWLRGVLWAPAIGFSTIPLLVLFPDGHLPSRRFLPVLLAAPVFVLLAVAGNGFVPWGAEENPFVVEGFEPVASILTALAGFALILGVGGGVLALLVRYRRAGLVERQQLKWFLAAGATIPALLTLADTFQSPSIVGPIFFTVAMAVLPIAIGIAITRYRLYEIDRIISRTLAYAVVVGVLVAVYAGAVIGFGAVARAVAGESSSDLVVAASTLLVAAVFGPVRRRVRVAVDGRFDRAHYDAARTVETFSQSLRDEVDLDALIGELREVTQHAVKPRQASIWLPAEASP